MHTKTAPRHIVIIGSGIGGLTAGIILAKLDYRVIIVERNPFPGGLMRSYVRSGIDCPVGVHYMGSLGQGEPLRRLWDYLGVTPSIPLERMGLQGVIDRYIFDDFSFDFHEGIDDFEDNLKQSFPQDSDRIRAMMIDMRKLSNSLYSLDFLMPLTTNLFTPDYFEPMGEQLLRTGCSKRLLSVLGVPPSLIGLSLQQCPAFYYHMTIASYLFSAWRLACSSSEMADSFVSRFTSLGGLIVTKDGVEKILVQSGRVKGVALQSGRIIQADTVIGAVHPRNILGMLPSEAPKPSYAERILDLKNTKGLFSVTLSLDADRHAALPYNIYRVYPEEEGSLIRGIFHQLRSSRQPGKNVLSMMTTSDIKEWLQWEDTLSGMRGKDYIDAKEQKVHHFIAEASKLFGPLKEAEILDSYTPLTIRDFVASPDGCAYGILRSAKQLMKTASLHRSSIEGLFLAGQSSMVPGIMGTTIGSFQTVRRVVGHDIFQRDVMGNIL